ncbi:hypothetical protein BU23DRAFT_259736 [Bimuria novae-zelandiae CBS 107.79]|uniref:C2H2-type domain-containing protein n=1 Tax=Bimuria novae-zelandiae CBS 107.79 TaxID=1447943 RepID=A0A6A5UV54_9PLEO|nr:hypothetical protein BU23DRAFT_259736 [Bimuria novae-zelandiae CBS 107.79]
MLRPEPHQEMANTQNCVPRFDQAHLGVPLDQQYHQRRGSVVSSVESSTSSASNPIKCDDCGRAYCGEYRRGNLARHRRQKHGHKEQKYPCEEPACEAIFKRQDARLKHYRKHHNWRAPNGPVIRKL